MSPFAFGKFVKLAGPMDKLPKVDVPNMHPHNARTLPQVKPVFQGVPYADPRLPKFPTGSANDLFQQAIRKPAPIDTSRMPPRANTRRYDEWMEAQRRTNPRSAYAFETEQFRNRDMAPPDVKELDRLQNMYAPRATVPAQQFPTRTMPGLDLAHQEAKNDFKAQYNAATRQPDQSVVPDYLKTRATFKDPLLNSTYTSPLNDFVPPTRTALQYTVPPQRFGRPDPNVQPKLVGDRHHADEALGGAYDTLGGYVPNETFDFNRLSPDWKSEIAKHMP
jgi:hypothetical protein